jgi:hypothetical protein
MQQKAKKYQTGELDHTHAVRGQAFKQLENMCDPHTTLIMCKCACTPIQDKDQYLSNVYNVKVLSHYFIKICFSHSPDHNTFGLLQYQLQSQHEKCYLFRLQSFLFVSYYHFTSVNESPQLYSKLRDLFNSERIKFITRHDGFMLNTSQLIINNYSVT